MIKKCINCGEQKEHHAKGMCYSCYKKHSWKPKVFVCKRCKREMPYHGKGLCAGCYQSVFHMENNKAWNHKKRHNIDLDTYKKITAKCIICGFDKVVELHHLDENSKNNSQENMIGLCPNHHKMLHRFEFRQEIFNQLKEKGFNVPEDVKMDFKLGA